MFSKEERCKYSINPLAEVICQLRFPEILKISTTIPDDFQEAIRAEFPRFSQRKETSKNIIPGQEPPPATVNYQFSSVDGIWRVNLTSKFISMSCSHYTCWEDFAHKLDRPLAVFIQLYKPACFDRVGLRYLNFISRFELGLEGIPFSELIQPCYLGPLSEEDIQESAVNQCTVDVDIAVRGGCRVKIHAGPGMTKKNGQSDKELKFIFDQDLYMPGQIAVSLSAGALHTLHAQAYSVFRGAVTEKLHNAMEPESL